MGSQRPDADPAIQLQLEAALRHRWSKRASLLLSSFSRIDQKSANRGVPEGALGHDRPKDIDHLGSTAGASIEARQKLRGDSARWYRVGIPACVRARAQSGGIHLGLSEIACDAELLCQRSDASEAACQFQIAFDAASLHAGHCVLETGRAVLR